MPGNSHVATLGQTVFDLYFSSIAQVCKYAVCFLPAWKNGAEQITGPRTR